MVVVSVVVLVVVVVVVVASTRYSINILTADEATLLSPRKMEEFLCDLTFWGTFRTKEIWLDAVDVVTKHCDKFSVDGGTLQSMQKEAISRDMR